MSRRGRAPERTCVGCGRVSAKPQLLRLVKAPGGGVILDRRGVEPGRGAYVHRDAACFERAVVRRALSRALRTGLTIAEVSRLRERLERELETA